MIFAQPFWLRSLIGQLKQGTGIEQLPPRAKAWPDFFDNTEGIGDVKRKAFYKKSLTYKGRLGEYPIEKKIGIELHQMACKFGTSSSRRRFWAKAINDGRIPDELLEKFKEGLEGERGEVLAQVATQLALHERFWKVPYHYLGLLNGDLLYNNPISRYTYHGNGGNGPLIGVAMEGHFPGIESIRKTKHDGFDSHVIATARAAVRLAVTKSREEGAPVERIYGHRQYSSGRTGDPGEGLWREVVLPMAKELDLEVRLDFKHGSGKKIPRDWDPRGLVDYKGRALR